MPSTWGSHRRKETEGKSLSLIFSPTQGLVLLQRAVAMQRCLFKRSLAQTRSVPVAAVAALSLLGLEAVA